MVLQYHERIRTASYHPNSSSPRDNNWVRGNPNFLKLPSMLNVLQPMVTASIRFGKQNSLCQEISTPNIICLFFILTFKQQSYHSSIDIHTCLRVFIWGAYGRVKSKWHWSVGTDAAIGSGSPVRWRMGDDLSSITLTCDQSWLTSSCTTRRKPGKLHSSNDARQKTSAWPGPWSQPNGWSLTFLRSICSLNMSTFLEERPYGLRMLKEETQFPRKEERWFEK